MEISIFAFGQLVQHLADIYEQCGQIAPRRVPDNSKVDFEIAMRENIAHFICVLKGLFRMLLGEFGMVPENIAARLANDLQVAYDGILQERV